MWDVNPSRLLATLFLFALLLTPPLAHAQGCTQCRDNTAATPPATQAAYRHAITLLILSAGSIFIGTVLFMRKQNRK